ncbi:MAG: 6-hydroxymethylpterin diphosphokinase MptE-like protein [Rhodocyclaceae bacterium]
MTPLQQTYLSKLHATAAANLEFFKLNLPEIHQRVVAASPLPTLDISDQGDLTLRYPDGSGRPLAVERVRLEEKFREFADPVTRPQLLAFHALRAVSEQPSHGDMQRYHYSNIDAEFPNRARRHFVQHYPDDAGLHRYPVFGSPHTIPLLIVLGSGMGGHLSRLVLEYDVRHLVVLDCDEDAFRVSLFFQDYVELSRLAMEKGTDLAFIIGPDIDHLTRGMMGVLRKSLPPFFVHGAALFYAMPEGETLEAIKTCIRESLWQMYFGQGYFDDELISVRHTLKNFAAGRPVYIRPRVVDSKPVAFVIGSGPSLDELLPLLREQRDKAVLFSCGTALGPLSHAGIVPDFHIEKERPGIVFDVLTRTIPEAFRKKIRFIGLNVVMPEVFDLFGWAGMAMKEVDTMSAVLHGMGSVPRVPIDSQPTVTNMALSLALTLGFERIYLAGVDLGYRDKERHHSRHSAYLGKLPEAEHLRRLLQKRPGDEKQVPANFGGEAWTNGILEMARLYMENTIRACPHAEIYNLNDGVAIAGARPLRVEEFPAVRETADKESALSSIMGAFEPCAIEVPAVAAALLRSVDELIEAFRNLLAGKRDTRADVLDTIVALYQHLRNEEVKNSPAGILFQGTVFNLLSLCYNALSIIRDEDEAVAKAEYDFINLMDALQAGRAEISRALGEEKANEEPA